RLPPDPVDVLEASRDLGDELRDRLGRLRPHLPDPRRIGEHPVGGLAHLAQRGLRRLHARAQRDLPRSDERLLLGVHRRAIDIVLALADLLQRLLRLEVAADGAPGAFDRTTNALAQLELHVVGPAPSLLLLALDDRAEE